MAHPTNGSLDGYHIGVQSCGGDDAQAVPCFRAILSGVLAVATLSLCAIKLHRAWKVKADRVEHYFVTCFILAAAECAILAYRWLSGGSTTEHFIAIYLHVLQFLLLLVYYTNRVLRARKQPHLIKRLCYPTRAIIFAYFTSVLGWALSHRHADQTECQSLAWILYSGSMIALAALFIVLGVLLTRAMNKFPTSDPSLVWWKRVHLWSLIAAYAMAAAVQFGFDLAFHYLTENHENCDGVYGTPSSFSYTLYILMDRLFLLGPVWVMLAVLNCGSVSPVLTELQDATVSVFRPSESRGTLGSMDSTVQWGADEVSGEEIVDVFEKEVHEYTKLLDSAPSGWQTHKSYS